MTSARRQRKQRISGLLLAAAFAGVTGWAAATEQVVVDRFTGLAIAGFDPVAYFTDKAAKPGDERYEYTFAGVAWRFRNPGNRAAFVDHPEVYMPQFGGYDPVGVARGVPVAGDPRLWVRHGESIFLFSAAETRAAFVGEPDRIIARADKSWPDLRRTLAP